MDWILNYQLFLFDFDGILVNTEQLHYKAYIKMCADRGFSLNWDQKTYLKHALFNSTGLRDGIYREFPDLKRFEPCWDILYQEKKRAYFDLLYEEGTSLVPGVAELLEALQAAKIKRCVVTNSVKEHVDLIRKQHPILDSIPDWVTREQYSDPKPSPECYLKAIERLAAPDDRIIGFEDSPRGLQALLKTKAEGVFISSYLTPAEFSVKGNFSHFPSFVELFKNREG